MFIEVSIFWCVLLGFFIGFIASYFMLRRQDKKHEKAMMEVLDILDAEIEASKRGNKESAELIKKLTKVS